MSPNVKINNHTTLTYAAALWLACVFVGSSAFAADARTEVVKFADLNVNTPAGVEALYGRIHAAAQRVCDQPAGEQAAIKPCVTKAESQAIGRANLPLLTAFYQKLTGKTPPTFTANR
jgi:UrcA family protein